MNFGLPGSAGSVPTVLHDATDTGTDYILNTLLWWGPRVAKRCPGSLKFLAGPKVAKMIPRDFKIQQK